MAGVELRGLNKVYPNGVEAVATVDLDVGDGEFFAVVGPSGSGKSTLLRLIAGLESPDAGSVRIGGRDVTALAPRDRDVAMVFQDAALYPFLTVFDNLAFGLRARGYARSEIRARVEPVASALGLEGVLGRRPQTLSGGQRQRVAIGRAIVRRPAVFLLDEPLSSLDAPLRASVRGDLIDLHHRLGATMIYVTHDQGEALAMGDRVGVMERGRVVQTGPPREVYERPADRFIAGFVGSPPMSVLPCRVVAGDGPLRVGLEGHVAEVQFLVLEGRWLGALAARRGRRVELTFRPEHVTLALIAGFQHPKLTWLPVSAEVRHTEFLGHETLVTLGLLAFTLVARLPATTTTRPGDRFAVGLDLDRATWFDAEDGAVIPTDPG